MNQNWDDDTSDFNRSNEFVVDNSAGFDPIKPEESYLWLERYLPYEGSYWFIRFPK